MLMNLFLSRFSDCSPVLLVASELKSESSCSHNNIASVNKNIVNRTTSGLYHRKGNMDKLSRPTSWNSLPQSFRDATPTLRQFQRRLKTSLFRLAYGRDLIVHSWLSRWCTINVRTKLNWPRRGVLHPPDWAHRWMYRSLCDVWPMVHFPTVGWQLTARCTTNVTWQSKSFWKQSLQPITRPIATKKTQENIQHKYKLNKPKLHWGLHPEMKLGVNSGHERGLTVNADSIRIGSNKCYLFNHDTGRYDNARWWADVTQTSWCAIHLTVLDFLVLSSHLIYTL